MKISTVRMFQFPHSFHVNWLVLKKNKYPRCRLILSGNESKPTVNSSLHHLSGHILPLAKLNAGGKTLPSQREGSRKVLILQEKGRTRACIHPQQGVEKLHTVYMVLLPLSSSLKRKDDSAMQDLKLTQPAYLPQHTK